MTLTLAALFGLIAVGAVLLDPSAPRRVAAVGLTPLGLGVAALGASPGPGPMADLARHAAAAGLPPSYLAPSLSLVVLGLLLEIGGALAALHRAPRAAAAGSGLLLAAAGTALWLLAPAVELAGAGRVAALGLGLAAVGGGLGAVAGLTRISGGVRWLDAHGLARGQPPDRWPLPRRGDGPALAGLAAGTLAVAAGPHVAIVFLGAAAAAFGGLVYLRRHGENVLPLLPVLPALTLLLAPIYWLMATIAGPIGLSVATLPDAPFSPAAQTLLGLPLAIVVWGFAGPWPLHGVVPGRLLLPVGVLLWLRVAQPAVPDGLEHWQPLLAPLALAGIGYGALAGRLAAAFTGLGLFALVSVRPEAALAAWLLAAAVVGLVLLGPGPARGPAGAARRLCWALGGYGGALALGAGLRAQVVYTVLAAAALAAAWWTGLAEEPAGEDLTATPLAAVP